jgi:Family of unknown function (DUF6338)
MPATLVALTITVAAVLPGFVTVELTQRQRAVRAGEDAQSLVLRALFYALLIHLAWSWWTWSLAQSLEGTNWRRDLGALVSWALIVLVVSPIAVGLPLNRLLRRAESRGTLSWWQYSLGGRDARDAWDLAFQRAAVEGSWVLVHLKGDTSEAPRLVLGEYGRGSAAGQSPAEHDLFLHEIWSADEFGRPVAKLHPSRSMWVCKDRIAELYFLKGEPQLQAKV